ncbi:polysaccharide biosynthesis tyrosine autokinase [Nucisporomicrobium flavum]|uniref:polysaccharide biosynthesis tyrosine autokinase n=1 Tax=Nucisporomicrobium flavum TaxID=2785915 RepID=UPI0018F3C9AA|nr:polysaccharide biosynthesis tyrosine autokinase [Nucisporomicrobium flavum]
MDLRDYLRAVRKRWWLVAGAIAVSVGVAVTVTLLTPPKYAASVTFFVSTRGTEVTQAFQGGQFAQQRVKSYVDVLTSNRLAQAIAVQESTGLTAEEIQGEVTAQVVPDTVLVEATVTDTDRARALRLAQRLAAQFPELISKLETPPGSKTSTVGVQIIAEPKLADAPVSPQPVRNVGLAVALGLIIGVGAAALRESLDSTIRTPEALHDAASAPVLSAIPFDRKAEKAPLITEGSAQSTRAEAMRQLRTNLQFVNVDRPLRSLVVSSALPGEGKSTTVCNLGIAFAEAGKRVIIIDADLRRPRIAEYLGLEGAVGLTNVLAGQAKVRDVVQSWGKSGLWVLPSGYVPPNPSELLGSGNMADLLTALGTAFDVILIDTPPLLPVTDAAVMSTLADGCLLVSRHAKTTVSQAATAAAALAKVSAKLHGCVLNMTPAKSAGSYAYYSYTTETSEAPEAVAAPTPRVPAPATNQPLPASPFRRDYNPIPVRTEVRPSRHQRTVDAIDTPTTDLSIYRKVEDGHYEGTAAVPPIKRHR